jgi:mannosyltransferase OCH1-like enzyme
MGLILGAVLDLLHGIDAQSIDQYAQLNESDRRIPLIIHQTWKTNDLSSYPISNSHVNWTVVYPDFEIRLWTDAHIDRLIILHRYGGIYADLDVYPSQRSLDNLLLKNVSFVIARSSSDGCVMNHFMIAERHSPVIEKIPRRATRKAWFEQI